MNELRQFARPAYVVSIALILIPLADTMTSLYPWRVFEARWRFGAVGLISNALLLPSVGLLLACITAALSEHRGTRKVIGVATIAASAFCLLALVMFGLDAIQTRASVQPQMRLSFNVASIAAAFKTLIAGITAATIGLAALRGQRSQARKSKSDLAPIFQTQPSTTTPRD